MRRLPGSGSSSDLDPTTRRLPSSSSVTCLMPSHPSDSSEMVHWLWSYAAGNGVFVGVSVTVGVRVAVRVEVGVEVARGLGVEVGVSCVGSASTGGGAQAPNNIMRPTANSHLLRPEVRFAIRAPYYTPALDEYAINHCPSQ